jgi:single-strand DNA-binding protein
MNNHLIHGRLVRDPQLTPRANSDSSDRVNFTVAVDRRGEGTVFIDCVAFGKRAEVIEKFFSKGQEIICWGEGRLNSYADKNGIKRKSYSIFVEGFDFCGSKKDGNSSGADSWEQLDEDDPFQP